VHGKAWKAKDGLEVFYGNTTLQPRYCRSVLGFEDLIQKYFYQPSKITQGTLLIVDLLGPDINHRDEAYVHLQHDSGLRLHTGRPSITYRGNS